ncbi:hypothetical protein O3P69_012426 [Scylla paramamosain]|uniref:Uncharacterized protein n=1 Tax=Scylla paramamosain TaxID=85552 RepID=A0AAW0SBY3_SCYPA
MRKGHSSAPPSSWLEWSYLTLHKGLQVWAGLQMTMLVTEPWQEEVTLPRTFRVRETLAEDTEGESVPASLPTTPKSTTTLSSLQRKHNQHDPFSPEVQRIPKSVEDQILTRTGWHLTVFNRLKGFSMEHC